MQYKKDFPIFKFNKNLVYLDSAATSQKPQVVIDAVSDFYEKYNSNVHRGLYSLSEKAEFLYENTRKKVAKFINASNASEIVFTSNTTESINLAAFGYFNKFLKKGDIIILSEMEHHSNIVPWLQLKKTIGIKIYFLPINKNFELDYNSIFDKNLDYKKIKLIALTHASNVLGTINHLEKMIPVLKNKFPYAKILIDAAQSIAHIPVNVKKLDTDFLAFSSHKMFGPSGVGVLYIKKSLETEMNPLLFGGHMISEVSKENASFLEAPAKFEAGTGRLEAVVGLGTAIDFINKVGIKNIQKYENALTLYTLERLLKIKIIQLYGKVTLKNRLPIFTFNIKGVHAHDVSEILNRYGVCIRAGYHCAQILMKACNTNATARASLSIYNTTEDIDKFINSLNKVNKILKI